MTTKRGAYESEKSVIAPGSHKTMVIGETYDPPAKTVLVTETGDAILTDMEGTTITYPAVPAYTYLVGRMIRLESSSTATVVAYF